MGAAKLAPRWNPLFAKCGTANSSGANRATLAVARKLLAYLLAVDRSAQALVEESRVAGRRPTKNFLERGKISVVARSLRNS